MFSFAVSTIPWPDNHWSAFFHYSFVCSRVEYQWNQTVVFCVWLLPLSIMFLRLIHVVSVSVLFHGKELHNFYNHSMVDENWFISNSELLHIICIYISLYVYNVCIIPLCTFLYVCTRPYIFIFLGMWFYGKCIFNFTRYCNTVCKNGCTVCIPVTTVWGF